MTDEVYIFIEDTLWKAFEKIGTFEDHTTPLVFVPFHDKQEYDEEEDKWVEPKKSMKLCVPDMSSLKNVTLGKRSGLMIFGV